jgi:2-polyprenyl-6-methoxyphenol hydroxylase-like FAD-dependent oxidoreductase
MKQFDPERKKAVVIGGSMSGLLAARILSYFYEQVTVLERDDLSTDGENRRGVPQGWHAHGLLASGSQVLEELFPGISNELIEAGAVSADVVNDGRWFFEGGSLSRVPSGTMGLLLSRPFLETAIRRRVRDLNGVEIRGNCTVRGLIMDGDVAQGVVTADASIEADLVIDASGRGSQSPKWLASLDFPVPREEKVEVQLAYTTRYFRRRGTDPDGCLFTAVTASPGNKGSGVILAQEGDRWVVTLIGRFGVNPPEDLDGFIRYAKSLDAPYIYGAIRNAQPIGDAVTMRFPASVRRRYEKLNRFPKGFLAFGDAICSFNPVYGQGMSVAAMQARALRGQLSSGGEDLAKRFYKAASKVIDTPWNIAVGSDLRMPEVKGKRTLGGRLLTWYIGRLHRFAHNDGKTALTFLRVAQLLDEPSALLHPKVAWRVLAGRRRSLGQPEARNSAFTRRLNESIDTEG